MNLQSWLSQWLTVWCTEKNPSTLTGYEGLAQNHVLPAIGELPLTSITPEHIQMLVNAQRQQSHTRTAQLVYDLLASSLRRAVRSGHLESNPADLVDRPRHASQPGYALTLEEEAAFLDAAQQSPHFLAFALFLRAGLRRGEVMGLQWADVDLSENWLHIRRTVTPIKGQLVIGPPKSRAGLRSVPLCKTLHDALSRQRIHALSLGKASGPCLVVPGKNGGIITPSTLRYACNRLCEDAAIRRVRLHDLRHTFATRAMQRGINPKTLQTILGHASMKLTLDLYSHAQREFIQFDFVESFGVM